MVSDAHDAVSAVPGVESVVVELDDHHDSDLINRGMAAGLGYRGTFGHEAEESLDGLRATFTRKAHTAAMERALTALLRADPSADVGAVTLATSPGDAARGPCGAGGPTVGPARSTTRRRASARDDGTRHGPADAAMVCAGARSVAGSPSTATPILPRCSPPLPGAERTRSPARLTVPCSPWGPP
jgi:hypothetical protein